MCKFLSGVAPCSRYICWCGERDMWRPIAPGKVSIVAIFCSNALTLYCVFLFPHLPLPVILQKTPRRTHSATNPTSSPTTLFRFSPIDIKIYASQTKDMNKCCCTR